LGGEVVDDAFGNALGREFRMVDEKGGVVGVGKEAGFENNGGGHGVKGMLIAPPGEGIVAAHVASNIVVPGEVGAGLVACGDGLDKVFGVAGEVTPGSGEFEAVGGEVFATVGVNGDKDIGPVGGGDSGREEVNGDAFLAEEFGGFFGDGEIDFGFRFATARGAGVGTEAGELFG